MYIYIAITTHATATGREVGSLAIFIKKKGLQKTTSVWW